MGVTLSDREGSEKTVGTRVNAARIVERSQWRLRVICDNEGSADWKLKVKIYKTISRPDSVVWSRSMRTKEKGREATGTTEL